MHTFSRTWVNPRVKESSQRRALNDARRKLCPNSPFWCADFDLVKHKEEWEEGRKRRTRQKMARNIKVIEERRKLQDSEFAIPPHLRTAFGGKAFSSNHGPVLSWETIFCPQWQKGKENIADWPNKSEMRYEGDDRISTDRLHRRFLGAPRVEGNETVNWQHRAVIEQFPFDDFNTNLDFVEIFLRTHWVAELEFSEVEAEEVLGKDLMQMLDPQDQW